MASTFFGLNIASSGLYTYQAALNTTAHNASNVETVGYTRQTLNTSAKLPISVYTKYGMVGTGVTGVSITQSRDIYYDVKYRNNTSIANTYAKKTYYMTQIQNNFNELDETGFLKALNNFNNSLQDLTTAPSDSAYRTAVISNASSMTSYVNSVAESLQRVQKDANEEIKTSVNRINSLSQQITNVTKQINALEVSGQFANDLRDTRNNLVDELSKYANVSVDEKVVVGETGMTTYVVKLDGRVLINTNDYSELKAVPRTTKVNETDAEGLYDIYWADGDAFAATSLTLEGTLPGLIAVRDGNNSNNFAGAVSKQEVKGGITYVSITGDKLPTEIKANLTNEGSITLGKYDLSYKGYEISVDADGKYTYTFALDPHDTDLVDDKGVARDFTGSNAKIGDPVNYKGIPYYMGQLNEFVRTFAKEFNDLHKTGMNLNGETNVDFFSAVDKVTGNDITLHGKGDAITASNSYAQMNCLNFSVSSAVKKNPSAMSTAYDITNGVDQTDLLKDLIAKIGDKSMFSAGTPESYITSIVADVGIFTKEIETAEKSQTSILGAIEVQRMSISGVDTDEEAMNLVRYQNAYNLSAKVLQVMDEIYDKLINYTGV